MTLAFETYLAVGLSMALLSLWKTYSGPAIAAFLSYSYPEMLVFNLIPAMLAAYAGWQIAPVYSRLFKKRKEVVFNPKLRKFMRKWNQYGQLSMAILAPVLVGIPSYTFVSKRLNQSGVKTFGLLVLSILGWSSLAYSGFALLDLSQYIELETIIPASVLEVVRQ
ncbi:hypothetical protein KI655_02155 [Vibrio sp. D404a]|uniref:hypothetical protein n=1 Tax=unclassified Vibrio TaxID=2614977 RepID=UPI0025556538|nr:MULTISPECIES: hypothetical protein [unclassified Vibrio]MDK9736092.1 hypothetical protein [Vibrio sp. D404a]MDK9797742.1 hypothetical protein [Vibrio sp. D449a]